jgi:hypothetical protein
VYQAMRIVNIYLFGLLNFENIMPKKFVYKGNQDESSSDETTTSKDRFGNKAEKKKKNAIVDYKTAINNIGSKANALVTTCFSKNANDKVIITESEYKTTDDWLIDDMRKNSEKRSTRNPSASNKRKYSFDKSDDSSLSDNNEENRDRHNNNEEMRKHTSKKCVDFYLDDNENNSKMNKNYSKKRLLDVNMDTESDDMCLSSPYLPQTNSETHAKECEKERLLSSKDTDNVLQGFSTLNV